MTTQTNAPIEAALSTDDAANLFLSRWKDEPDQEAGPGDEPPAEIEEELTGEEAEGSEEEGSVPDEEATEVDEDHQEPDQEETEAEEETAEEDEEGAEKSVLSDEAVIKVKVDGQELDVSVKDLKRLYGQEAALTRKSQEVAQKRQEAEAQAGKLNAALEKLYAKAADRFKPYADIDWLVANKQLDAEQFAALRAEAQAAYEDFRFISEEADAFVTQQKEAQAQEVQKAATECVKVLKAEIPGWSEEVYRDLRDYAATQGLGAEVFNTIVDPVAIKLIHKARMFDQAKSVKTTKKVAPAPKKVLKTTVAPVVKPSGNSQKTVAARARLEQTGSVDAAAELFMSRWARDDE